jgi:hypothetical protein
MIVTGDLGMQMRVGTHGPCQAKMPDRYAKDAMRRSAATPQQWEQIKKILMQAKTGISNMAKTPPSSA